MLELHQPFPRIFSRNLTFGGAGGIRTHNAEASVLQTDGPTNRPSTPKTLQMVDPERFERSTKGTKSPMLSPHDRAQFESANHPFREDN